MYHGFKSNMEDLGKKVISEKFSGLKDLIFSTPKHNITRQRDWALSKLKLFILQKDEEETISEKDVSEAQK